MFNGITLGRGVDGLKRVNSLGVSALSYSTSYGFDDASRLKTVTSGSDTAEYARHANSELLHAAIKSKRQMEPRLTTRKSYPS